MSEQQQGYRLGLPEPEPQTHPSIEIPAQRPAEATGGHRVTGASRAPEQAAAPTSRAVVDRNDALMYLVVTLAIWGVAIKLGMNWWFLDDNQVSRIIDGALTVLFVVKAAVATRCTWTRYGLTMRGKGRRRA